MNSNCILFGYWLEKHFEINKYNSSVETTQVGGGSKGKKKWTTLSHNGVLFPPEYEPHGIPVIYKDEKIVLPKEAEEFGTIYAKYSDTEYHKNNVFNKNFWNDWSKILGKDHKIKSLADCNFKLIYDHILKLKENKKPLTAQEKEDKELVEKKYKIAIVDGKEQPVGNFRVEPPGIFIGRGCNPHLGRIKRRIDAEDIIINIGKEATIPQAPKGHQWKSIIHDNTVEWLASWPDEITGKTKYVWLGAQSDSKAKSDMQKFDLARKLKRKIKTIRDMNDKNLSNDDEKIRQIATAIYFIDNYALRVGNEKTEDQTDTVGVTSLRVEHIQLLENLIVKLDFLSKDSVRYNRALPVSRQVYKNLEEFTKGKRKDDQLFDKIASNDVNKYLQLFMKGLSAKVYRTYNASSLFQKELSKISKKYDKDTALNILLDEFNKANGKVALLCNHQKNINKNNNEQIKKIDDLIKKTKSRLRKASNSSRKNPETILKLRERIKILKTKKELKMELKNVSLGTSKTNYIDPRITVAFMKKYNIPVDKVFSTTLREKFKWAFDVDENFVF